MRLHLRLLLACLALLLTVSVRALSPADEADMIRGMAYLRTNYNDPVGLPVVDAVMQRTNYSAEEWSDFYRRYFSTNTYTYALRFNWYWRGGHINGWATPARTLNQQLALYQVGTNRIEALYSAHPEDLGQHLAALGAADREDLVAWNLLLWDVSALAAPGFDPRNRGVDWIVGLRTRYPQWLATDRFLDPSRQPYAALFRAQYQLTIRDTLQRLGDSRNEIAEQLVLTGTRRRIFVNHGQHLLDNQFLNSRDLAALEQFLDSLPPHLPKTPLLLWNNYLGNSGDRSIPWAFDGIHNNMTDWHAGDQRDSYWLTDDVPIATDAGLGHAAGEASHAWRQWLTANGQDERQEALRISAGLDARNYVHSKRVIAEPDFAHLQYAFFYDLNRVCFNHTEAAFTSASRRFLLEGRFQPLAQFLWWLDVWSGLGTTAQGFVLDERGGITRYDIPLTRDGSGRIRTFRMQGTTWQVGYFTSTRPNSLVPLDAAAPLMASVGELLGGTNLFVSFNGLVSPASATNLANYSVNGVRPVAVSLQPDLRGVALTFAPALSGDISVTVSNLRNLAGTTLASPVTLPVRGSSWQALDLVPADRMQPPSQSAVLESASVDVVAGGRTFHDNDDAHFVYRAATGDFDARVRLAEFTTLEYYAQATLEARAAVTNWAWNLGVGAYPASGRNLFFTMGRSQPGPGIRVWPSGRYHEGGVGTNSMLRLVRVGNHFTGLASPDGTSWEVLGNWQVSFPNQVFLGLGTGAYNDGRPNKVTVRYRDFAQSTPHPLVWLENPLLSSAMLESGGRVARLRVRASAPEGTPLTVRLAVTGTATAGADYQTLPSQVQIPAGTTDTVIEVRLLNDSLQEGPETLQIAIAPDPAYEVVASPLTLTILDDENPIGGLVRAFYYDVGSSRLTNLTSNPKFPARPDSTDLLSTFEMPDGLIAFNHGTKITGYLLPPATDDYRFIVAGADECELYLSTNESPSNARLIAQEPQWSGVRQWDVRPNGEKGSDAIRLEGGKRYYVELRHIRGGSDHFGVTWHRISEGAPGRGAEPIPGEFLSLRLEDAAPAVLSSFWVKWPEANGGNEHWYGLLSGNLRWTDAEAYANTQEGTHFATIRSQAEQDFVWSTFPRTNIWIGLTDEGTEGRFRWANGEPLDFTHWENGQPNNFPGEDYGLLTWFWGGRWADLQAGGGSGISGIGGALLERELAPDHTPESSMVHHWPTNQLVLPGATARFAVVADGAGPLTYQWQFNGEDISDATNSVFELPGVTADFAGQYRVRVSNPVASVLSPVAELRVGTPLRWMTEPKGVVSLAGNTVALGSLAEGTGQLTYQWFQNGTRLAGQTHSTLLRNQVSSVDNGLYEVQVSDGWTVLRSAPVELVVVNPGAANAPAMQTHLLENFVSATAGAAIWVPPSGAWSVRERLLGRSTPSGERTFLGSFGAEELTLTLLELPPHRQARLAFDLGVFGTWDGDQGGPDVWGFQIADGPGLAATFSNWEELGFTQSYPQPIGQGVFPAGTGAREIDTLGNTYPGDTIYGFDWMFGHTNRSLSVTFFGRNLQALNDEAWGLQAVRVEFDAPPPVPRIATQPTDRSGALGTTQLLLVTVEQPQPLQYLWRKDGVPLPGATNRTLSVILTNVSVMGGYDVVVANSSGSVTSRLAQVTMEVEIVQFATNAMTVTELQGALSLPILRTGGTNGLTLGVVYGGNAVTNVDFQGGFPFVQGGQPTGGLNLRILDDPVVDGARTLTVTLKPGNYPNLVMGTNATLTITIEDNDTEAGPGLGFDGRIRSIIPMPDGGLMVGGNFTTANGVPRRTVARLKSDFSLDAGFAPELTGWQVTTRLGVQSDGRVVVAGLFAGTISLRLLEPDGRAVIGYIPRVFQSSPGSISSFEIDGDGRIVLCGRLEGYGQGDNQSRAVMRLTADGSRDPEFAAGSAADPVSPSGFALVLNRDGSITVGGSFNNFGTSTNRGRIARERADGTFDPTFATGAGFNGSVLRLAEDRDGRVYASGLFGLFGTNPVPGWVRLDSGGRLDPTFNPVATGSNITSLAVLPDGNLLALRDTGMIEEYQRSGEAVGTLATNVTAFAIEPSGSVVVAVGVREDVVGGARLIRRIRPAGISTTTRVGMPWGVRSVLESEESVGILVRRTGPVEGEVEVRYRVTAGTAVAGTDLVLTNGVLRLGSGQQEGRIEVLLTAQNTTPNDDRTFQVELLEAIGASVDSGRSNCAVTLVDDDRGLQAEIFSKKADPQGSNLPANLSGGVPNTLLHPFSVFDRWLGSRRDPIVHFEWGAEGPREAPADEFSVIWSGWLVPEVSGEYQLATRSDDGSRIWLDGNLELKQWQYQSGFLRGTRSIPLVAGRPYRLVVHYMEWVGGSICHLLWRRTGEPLFETIPSRVLRPAGFSDERPTLSIDWLPDSQAFQVGYLTEPGRPIHIEQSTDSVNWTFLYEGNTESNGTPVLRLITKPAWSTQFLAGAVFRARTFDGLVSELTGAPLLTPSGTKLVAGRTNSITLQAVYNGGPNQTFTWLRDGHEVASGRSLVLNGTQADAAGNYQVLVSSPAGRVLSAPRRIHRFEPPQITVPLRDWTLFAGETVSVPAGVEGLELSYRWLRHGVPVVGQTNAVLAFNPVTLGNGGIYRVIVTNLAGSVTNGPALFRVRVPARFTAPLPALVNLDAGAELRLVAEVEGSGPFTYQWRLNGDDLPGATEAIYQVNPVGLAHAGTYTVIVSDETGALTGGPTEVRINTLNRPGNDALANATTLVGATSPVSGDSASATREIGEPDHAGKPSARTVWYAWTAPQSGRLSLRTLGSTFDTVLAVYTGSAVGALNEIASNDDVDRAYFTSELAFSAVAGTTYRIALGGVGEGGGHHVLAWEFVPAAPIVPGFVTQPGSQTVRPDERVELTAQVTGAQSFQWYFNGVPLPGANAATLVIGRLEPKAVGTYRLAATGGGQTVLSHDAVVELGANPDVRSYDKVEELLVFAPPLPARIGRAGAQPAGFGGAALVVSPGVPYAHVVNNANATTSLIDPNPCNQKVTRTRWLPLQVASVGRLVVRTEARFPIVLSLYRTNHIAGQRAASLVLPAHACATGPELRVDGLLPGETLLLSLASAEELAGEIPIEIRMGEALPAQPLAFVAPTLDRPANTPFTLRAWEGELDPKPQVTWLRNGQPLPGAFGRDLDIGNLTPAAAGLYRVVLDNGVSRVTNTIANVTLETPLSADPADVGVSGNTFRFLLTGTPGQRVVVERLASLDTVLDRHADWLGEHGLLYEDGGPGVVPWRFYRWDAEPLRLANVGALADGRSLWRITGGRLGRRYVLETSPNGVAWTPQLTNSVPRAEAFTLPLPINLQVRIRE